MLIISHEEVTRLLDLQELKKALKDGFMALSAGELDCPPRSQVSATDGALLSMPAFMPGQAISVKLVSIFHKNTTLPSHQAVVALFESTTGEPLAIMDGSSITALRTAACSMISIELLAGKDARQAVVVGCGVQGSAHLRALLEGFSFEKIMIACSDSKTGYLISPGYKNVFEAGSVKAAVANADVICLCTSAGAPVIESGWVKPGAHVVSVGYNPPGGELPLELIRRSKLFVESKRAFEPPPSGSVELQGVSPDFGTELGEVLLGRKPGRTAASEITVYKSMGHAMEDLVAANLIYKKALENQAGIHVNLGS